MNEKETTSQMNDIKNKSTDPAFLAECEIRAREIHQQNKETEYAQLLKNQVVEKIRQRDKSRVGFKKLCRES